MSPRPESRVAADPEQGASSDEKITPHHLVQDSPANFVQRVTAIRGERGQILSHGGCWHGSKFTMTAFPGQFQTSEYTQQ